MSPRDTAVAGASPAPPVCVLVVDDEPMLCDLIATCLQGERLEAALTPDPRVAVRLVTEGPSRFRLALIDLWLRGEDGAALTASLKRLAPGLSVILMSGEALAAVWGELLDVNFDGYLQKPFTPDQLLDEVRRLTVGQS